VLKVVREKTAWGMVPYLVGEHKIPAAELIRLAEELQLPIKCAGMTVFPKGKAAQDFAEKDDPKKVDQKPVKRKGLRHDVIVTDEDAGESEEVKEDTKTVGEETAGESEDEEKKETKEKKKTKTKEAEPATSAAHEEAVLDGAAKEMQKIEIERAAVVSEKPSASSQNGQSNGEAKEEEQKKKKTFSSFSEGVLSEGILS